MSQLKTQMLGLGCYLPEQRLTNADIEKMVETNDKWIVERTGIKERRIAPSKNFGTSELAIHAARKALQMAKLEPTDIDMIIFATVTPDQIMPSAACTLQAKLGTGPCVAWDLNAACSGFVFASSVANQYVKTGMYKHVLVIGAEILSRIVNYKDRETCILFGDGAGAAIWGRAPEGSSSQILAESLSSDGTLGELLTLPAGGSKIPITHETLDSGVGHMTMKGREIFKHAIRTMSRHATECLEASKMTIDDIHWVIPHQANQRIIEGVANQLNIPMSKVIMHMEYTGNTSAASVPIALVDALEKGLVKRGDLILIAVFGGGLTSGAILMRY